MSFNAHRNCGVDTKKGYVEILEFTHFVRLFSFDYICENHKEKVLANKVEDLRPERPTKNSASFNGDSNGKGWQVERRNSHCFSYATMHEKCVCPNVSCSKERGFEKTQEILGTDIQEGLKILEENR